MTDHAVTVLRKRREELAEQTREAEKRVTRLSSALANLDAAIAILTPEHPDYVSPQKRYKRTAYFERGELSRLVREALRDAGKPLAAGEIAATIIAAKSYPDAAHGAVRNMILTRLGVLVKRGEIAKTGATRDARWFLAAPVNSNSQV